MSEGGKGVRGTTTLIYLHIFHFGYFDKAENKWNKEKPKLQERFKKKKVHLKNAKKNYKVKSENSKGRKRLFLVLKMQKKKNRDKKGYEKMDEIWNPWKTFIPVYTQTHLQT